MEDDLNFIRKIKKQTIIEIEDLIDFLFEITKDLESGETIPVEMTDELIQLLLIAETILVDDSGIINHMLIQFYYNQ